MNIISAIACSIAVLLETKSTLLAMAAFFAVAAICITIENNKKI